MTPLKQYLIKVCQIPMILETLMTLTSPQNLETRNIVDHATHLGLFKLLKLV
jgi:hypothetical protein